MAFAEKAHKKAEGTGSPQAAHRLRPSLPHAMAALALALVSVSYAPSVQAHAATNSIRPMPLRSAAATPLMRLPFLKRDEPAMPKKQEQSGVVVPTVRFGGRAAKAPPAKEEPEEEEELGIKGLLTEYGLIALVFHFSVWVTSLASVYALLTLGLADSLTGLLSNFGGEEAGALGDAAGFAGRATATLGIVEAIGPARVALTIAATPKVSEKAREYEAVRDAEAWVDRNVEALTARFGSSS